uniref:Uncharacterized protein n=1 Tax=Arundo donax TaxID=35708 RepID=A0A0A9BA33_ARUDO
MQLNQSHSGNIKLSYSINLFSGTYILGSDGNRFSGKHIISAVLRP